MKGIQGLIVAIVLGIIGAVFNFAFLASKAREMKMVAFVGIKSDVTVARGDRLLEEHIVPVEVPRNAVGNLEKYAVPYSAVGSVTQMKVARTLEGGSLLLRTDMGTPPTELNFGQDTPPGVVECALGVRIDPQKIVPSLVQPGDLVSFIAPRTAGVTPTRAAPTDPAATGEPGKPDTLRPIPAATAGGGAIAGEEVDLVGPFKILSLGNRLSSTDIARGARMPQTQENVLMVLVKLENSQLEPQARRLVRLMEQNDARPLGYLLHPRTKKAE